MQKSKIRGVLSLSSVSPLAITADFVEFEMQDCIHVYLTLCRSSDCCFLRVFVSTPPLYNHCRRYVAGKRQAYLPNSYTSRREQEKGLLIIGIFLLSPECPPI